MDHQIRQSEEAAQEVDSRIKFGGWQKPAEANYPYVSQGSQTYQRHPSARTMNYIALQSLGLTKTITQKNLEHFVLHLFNDVARGCGMHTSTQ